jgi:hypothetical protein
LDAHLAPGSHFEGPAGCLGINGCGAAFGMDANRAAGIINRELAQCQRISARRQLNNVVTWVRGRDAYGLSQAGLAIGGDNVRKRVHQKRGENPSILKHLQDGPEATKETGPCGFPADGTKPMKK